MKFFKYLIFLFAVLFIFTGCETEKGVINWNVSPTFKAGDLTLYGNKDKVGLIKMNGNTEEDLFIAGAGGVYQLYFWGGGKELKGKYKLLATNKDTGKQLKLYEWPIETIKDNTGADASSGGKYSLPQEGLWKLDFYIDDKFFETIIVDVKKKTSAPATYQTVQSSPLKGPEFLIKRIGEILVKDVNSLTKSDLLQLSILDLNGENISEEERKTEQTIDLSLISQMENLKILSISHIPVKDFSFLANLPQLDALEIRQFKLKDIPTMDHFPHLTSLTLAEGDIVNLDFIDLVSTGLTSLNLTSNRVPDINNVKHLINLKFLDVSDNPIHSLKSIQFLTQLERLQIVSTLVSDLSPLKSVNHLNYLDIQKTNITSVNALTNLNSLKILILNKVKITDLQTLSGHKELQISETHILG